MAGTGGKLRPGLDVFLHELPHLGGRLGIGFELGFDEQAQGRVQGVAAKAAIQYQAPVVTAFSDHRYRYAKKSPLRGNGQALHHDVDYYHVIREHG